MKKFKDLEFKPYPAGFGKRATMKFENKYGVSVIFGENFYSNGIDTYELAIVNPEEIDYTTGITEDVEGYKTEPEITKLMKRVQELPTWNKG